MIRDLSTIALLPSVCVKSVPKALASLAGQALLNRSFMRINALIPCAFASLKSAYCLVPENKISARVKVSILEKKISLAPNITAKCAVLMTAAIFLVACETQQTTSSSSSSSSSSSPNSSSSPSSSSPSSSSSSASTSSSSPGGSSSSSPSASSSASSSGFPSAGGESFPSGESSASAGGEGYESVEGGAGEQGSSSEAMSDEEYVAVLEGELDASVAVFDGMILDERNTVEAMEDGYSGDGFPEGGFPDGEDGVGGDDAPLFEEGDLSADAGEGVVRPMPDGSVGQGDTGTARQSGTASRAGNDDGGMEGDTPLPGGGVPEDIGSGRDDDIVARQIREAALQEQDPVLREKLWEEYRKYKNQSKN